MFVLYADAERFVDNLGFPTLGVRVEEIVGFDGGGIQLRNSYGDEWSLTQPEPLCIGVICRSKPDGTIKSICDWWKFEAGEPLNVCEIKLDESGKTIENIVTKWVNSRLVKIIEIISTGNRDLIKQNSQLRHTYGALQSAFSQLELHIVKNQLHTPILQYNTREITNYYSPQTVDSTLRQVLPVLSPRVSYLELNFLPAIEKTKGELAVTLRIEPAGVIVAEWKLAYADLRSGWNGFPCPPIIEDLNEVILECRWSTPDGAPAVGLSASHWDIPYGAVRTSGGDQAMTLAMRIWSALPGVRPLSPPTAINSSVTMSDIGPVALPPGELAEARQYESANTIKRDYPSVSYVDGLGRLKVHPHGAVATIAELPNPLPEGARYVSATARTINPEGANIEYALIATPPDILPEAFLTAIRGPTAGFSGWRLVKAADFVRVTVVLDPLAGPQHRLFLATRLPPGQDESGAWATWGGVEVGFNEAPGNSLAVYEETHSAPDNRLQEEGFVHLKPSEAYDVAQQPVAQVDASQEADSEEVVSNLRVAVDRAHTSDSSCLRIVLTPDELSRAERFLVFSGQSYGYKSVRFLDNLQALLVHPHLGTRTIARLHLLEGTIAVFASCRTISPEAAPVVYAMAIGPADATSEEEIFPPYSGLDRGMDGFSGWRKIEPMVEERLVLTTEQPVKSGQSLYLCTYLNRDAWEAHAWATWSNIQIDVMRVLPTEVAAL